MLLDHLEIIREGNSPLKLSKLKFLKYNPSKIEYIKVKTTNKFKNIIEEVILVLFLLEMKNDKIIIKRIGK